MTIDANWAADVSMLLWGLQNAVSTFAVFAYRHGLPRPEIPGTEPRVAVILPVKGDEGLGRFLGLLRGQRYGRYRIVASIESDQDPALGALSAAQLQMGASIEIVIAGLAESWCRRRASCPGGPDFGPGSPSSSFWETSTPSCAGKSRRRYGRRSA
jgi:hypothetical protein